MKLTTLFLIIAVNCVIRNAASVGNAEYVGGILQDPHMVGSIPATHHIYRPEVFKMEFYKYEKLLKTCIGTEIMVRENRVLWLAAAECLDDKKYDTFVVETMFNDKVVRNFVRLTSSTPYRKHPKYNSVTKESNLAVMNPPITLYNDNRALRPRLPEKGDLFENKKVDIYLKWENVTKSTDLQHNFVLNSIRTNVIKDNWCNFWYPFSPIKRYNVCASGWYGKGLLQDDVGIPLVTMGNDLHFTLIGIATIIRPWTHWFGLPIEFLSIDPYLDWIHNG